MTVILAHLNGGPTDDDFVRLHRPILIIARRPALLSVSETRDETSDPPVTPLVVGTYAMRRDMLGEPVPHDLTGTVEFDWQGWRP